MSAPSRARRREIVDGILLLVVLTNILQLWLLTTTVDATLGGDDATVVPAGIASLACFLLNAGLYWYLRRLDARRAGRAPTGRADG